MQDFQQRVVDEKNELNKKYIALIAFSHSEIWNKVAPVEQDRLSRQANIMKQYIDILEERIRNFS